MAHEHASDMVEIKRKPGSRDDNFMADDDGFPFGTALHLESDLVTELGVDALSVGDVVEVRGFAVVRNKSEHQDKDGTEKSMSIQMTFMKLKREQSDHAEQIYGA